MEDQIKLIFKERPGVFSSYARVLFLRRKGLKPGAKLPNISAELSDITISKTEIEDYNKVCDLKNSKYMPILYPHVLASPVYMSILTHSKFPIHLIGALHLRNHIVQHRPIKLDESFDMLVKLTEQRVVKQGLEFDFTIQLTVKGERIWESITTWLKRGKFGKEFDASPNSDLIKPVPNAKHFIDLYIPNDIGKKYARITGDYNPIHMSKLLAPIFGLKRDVAHAMWACANTMAHLPNLPGDKPQRIDFSFKGPLFLDNKSIIKTQENENGLRFDLYCGDNSRPSINGNMSSVNPGFSLF